MTHHQDPADAAIALSLACLLALSGTYFYFRLRYGK